MNCIYIYEYVEQLNDKKKKTCDTSNNKDEKKKKMFVNYNLCTAGCGVHFENVANALINNRQDKFVQLFLGTCVTRELLIRRGIL